VLGQKLAALLCSELKGTETFQQRREDWGALGDFFPRGWREKRPGWGGCHLRMANLLLKTRHFLTLAVLVPVPANALCQVALIVFFYYYYFIL